MIRIIVQCNDTGAAAHVGGPVVTTYRTFEIEHPDLEAFLLGADTFDARTIVGGEIARATPAQEGGT